MIDVYLLLLRAEKEKIAGEVFNAGSENYKVIEIAQIVKSVLDSDVEIEITPSSDHRSYHISSDRIRRVLGFTPCYTIADAVRELQQAFNSGRIPDPDHPRYYNVRFMRDNKLV